eukprot:TRINITY_DN90507_c0_g1_i1.p1 TRINITY_DN90507_c0_g1~~TRINITY_DN90507_c0_g1_i1.p1  ORF type:complete len:513 (-),score=69.65 TRINITY_DN90507_c0_g1_i1:25-1563(-)
MSFEDKGQSPLHPLHICLSQLAPVSRGTPLYLCISQKLGLETHRLIPFLFDVEAILFKLKAHFGLGGCGLLTEAGELDPGANLLRLSQASRQFLFCELGRHEFMHEAPSDWELSGHNSHVVDLQQALLRTANSTCPNSRFLAGVIHFPTWAQRLSFFPKIENLQGHRSGSSSHGLDTGSLLCLALQLQLADRANLGLENGISSPPFLCCPDLLPVHFRAKLPFFVVVEIGSDVGGLCGERALRLDEAVSVLSECNKSISDTSESTRSYALHLLTWDAWMLNLTPRHRVLLDPPLTPDMQRDWLREMNTASFKEPSRMDLASFWEAKEPSKFQVWWRKWRELLLLGLQDAAGRLQSMQGPKKPEGVTMHFTPEHAGMEMLTAVDRFAYSLVDQEFENLGEDMEGELLGEGDVGEEHEPWDFAVHDDLQGARDMDPRRFRHVVARAAQLQREFSMSEWRENPYLEWHVSCRLGEAAIMLGFEDLASLQIDVRERIKRGEFGWDLDLGDPDGEQS